MLKATSAIVAFGAMCFLLGANMVADAGHPRVYATQASIAAGFIAVVALLLLAYALQRSHKAS